MDGAIGREGLCWALERSRHCLLLFFDLTCFLGKLLRDFYRGWPSDRLDVAKAHPVMFSHRKFIHLLL
jgi:hypothetical protein